MTTSRSKLNQISEKQKEINRTLKELRSAWGPNTKCVLCNKRNWQDGMHIIRRSYSDKLKDVPMNYVPGCWTCHDIMDNGTLEEFMQLPGSNKIIEVMMMLDKDYAYRFLHREPK